MGSKEKIEKVLTRDGEKIRLEQEVKKDWHSVEGFREGWIRQKIDKDFPTCPFCKSTQPNWEWRNIHEKIKGWLISKAKGSSKLYGTSILNPLLHQKRIHFRCQNCEAIISCFRHKRSRLWRIESAGKNEHIKHLVNEEYPDDILHEWGNAKTTTRPSHTEIREKYTEEKTATQSSTCPHCDLEIKKEADFCPQCGKKLAIRTNCSKCQPPVEKGEKHRSRVERN